MANMKDDGEGLGSMDVTRVFTIEVSLSCLVSSVCFLVCCCFVFFCCTIVAGSESPPLLCCARKCPGAQRGSVLYHFLCSSMYNYLNLIIVIFRK